MSAKMPLIEKATIVAPQLVEIIWNTDETLSVDLSSVRQLSDDDFFQQMVVDDWGHALEWPNGFDLGADKLYEMARQQAGLPTAAGFNDWMERNHLSLTKAAEALGMSRRMISYYRTGTRPVPTVVDLACTGWESRHHSEAA